MTTPQDDLELQSLARNIAGSGVQIRDPRVFKQFLADKQQEFTQRVGASRLQDLASQEAENAGISNPRVTRGSQRFNEARAAQGIEPGPSALPNITRGRGPIGLVQNILGSINPNFTALQPDIEPIIPESFVGESTGLERGVRQGIRQFSHPAELLITAETAGIGPGVAAAIRGSGTSTLRNIAARVAEPVAGGFGRRAGFEGGAALGANIGGEVVQETLPESVTGIPRTAAVIGGSLLTGGVGAGAGLKAVDALPSTSQLDRISPIGVADAADDVPLRPEEVIERQGLDQDLAIGAQNSPELQLERQINEISVDANLTSEQKTRTIEAARRLRQEVLPTAAAQKASDVGEAQARTAKRAVESNTKRPPLAQTPQEVADQALIGETDVEQLTRFIEGIQEISPALRADLEIERSLVRKRNVAEGARRMAGAPPEQKRAAFLSAMTELPAIPRFEALRPHILPQQIANLFSMIHRGDKLQLFDQSTASKGLAKILDGEVPIDSELIQLQKVFGRDLIAAIEQSQRSLGSRAFDVASDVSGIPRGLQSAYDISAVLRQGGILTISHPRKAFWGRDSAFARMLKAMGSEQAGKDSLARIEANPKVGLMTDPSLGNDALFIRNPFETNITKREEAFISRFIQRIPGIRASERGFSTYLNEITTKVGEDFIDGLSTQGVRLADGAGRDGIRTMNKFLNVATGRGTLGVFERSALIKKMATVVFWSPRLAASRIQVPIEGVKALRNLNAADPTIRAASRQISRDLAIYVGGMMSFLAMLKLSGMADVEMNPRSSDFGKIRVGNTRLDAWAGFQQIARYTAQIITGQSKSTRTGEVTSKQRSRVLGQFLRSKLAPGGVSSAATFLPEESLVLPGLTGGGNTFIGETVTGLPFSRTSRDSSGGLGRAARDSRTISAERFFLDQLIPFFEQDIEEALKEDGLLGASLGLSGALGVGVSSFPDAEGLQGAERRQ